MVSLSLSGIWCMIVGSAAVVLCCCKAELHTHSLGIVSGQSSLAIDYIDELKSTHLAFRFR